MIFTGEKNWVGKDESIFTQGGNSFIYRVRADFSEKDFALKLYKSDDLQGERYHRFLSEIEIVKGIVSVDGCVKYEDHGLYEGKPFYVMPFYKNGTFRSEFLMPTTHENNALYGLPIFH